jgi:hypothetical protein
MPSTIIGLPLHPLHVQSTVVFVPLAARIGHGDAEATWSGNASATP